MRSNVVRGCRKGLYRVGFWGIPASIAACAISSCAAAVALGASCKPNSRDIIARIRPEILVFDSNFGMHKIGRDVAKWFRYLETLIQRFVDHRTMFIVHAQTISRQDVDQAGNSSLVVLVNRTCESTVTGEKA